MYSTYIKLIYFSNPCTRPTLEEEKEIKANLHKCLGRISHRKVLALYKCFIRSGTFFIFIVKFILSDKQYKNKSYSDNNEHGGSAALTHAQREMKLVENHN